MCRYQILIFVLIAFVSLWRHFVSTVCESGGNILVYRYTHDSNFTHIPLGAFTTCRSATEVNLSFNAITTLTNHTFNDFVNLNILDLSQNAITTLPVNLLTSHLKLKVFNVAANLISGIPPGFLENTFELEVLDFSNNLIKEIPLKIFSRRMPRLKTVKFTHNLLSMFEPWPYVGHLPRLESFDLRWNNLAKFTNTQNWKFSMDKSQSDIYVDLRFNNFTKWTDGFLLQYFDATDAQSIDVILGQLNIDLRENMWHCDCNFHTVAKRIHGSFYQFKLPEVLKIQCASPQGLRDLFVLFKESFKNLSALVCDVVEDCPYQCKCLDIPEKASLNVDCNRSGLYRFPDMLPMLSYGNIKLNLNNNELTHMEDKPYTKYVSELYLANNRINTIDVNALKSLSNRIEYLDLSNNSLRSVPRGLEVLPSATVKLFLNPLKCTCDMTWMSNWLNSKTVPGEISLQCTTSGNEDLYITDVTDEVLDCNISFPISVAIVFSILLFFVIVLLATVKRCPYETKVLLYQFFKIHPSDRYEIDIEDGLEHDLFVSCDEDDIHLMQWVRRTLVHHLEDCKPHFKLFVPLRDLPRGVPEAQARLDNLEKSRRMVIILTAGYMRNEWNAFDLNQSDALEKGDGRVFYILYDEEGSDMAKREPWRSKMAERKAFTLGDRLFWIKVRYEMPIKKSKSK